MYIHGGRDPKRKPSHAWPSWHNHTGCYPRFSFCSTAGLSVARYGAEFEQEWEAWACFAITDHAFSIAINDPGLAWPHMWYDSGVELDRRIASGEVVARCEDYLAFGRTFRDGQRFFLGMEIEADVNGRIAVPEAVLEKLDLVIASIHHNPGEREKWAERHFQQLDRVLQLPCDIVGHPVRHLNAHSTPEQPLPKEIIEETLNRLAHAGVAVEINAHYPQLQDDVPLLQGAYARGMRVAFAADLHYPEEFGNWRYFEDVVEQSGIAYEALKLFYPTRRGAVREEQE